MPPKLHSSWSQLPPPFLLPFTAFPGVSTRSIQSIHPPRPNRFNKGPNLPVLTSTTTAALDRKAYTLPLRSGALAMKKGMTALYDPSTGKRMPCTVLQLDRNQVVSHKTRHKHGYYAVQIGAGWKHPSNVTRPMMGHFSGAGVSPKRFLCEFRVKDEKGLLPVGESVGAGWFREGQFVDARADSRGMGFAGVSSSWLCSRWRRRLIAIYAGYEKARLGRTTGITW